MTKRIDINFNNEPKCTNFYIYDNPLFIYLLVSIYTAISPNLSTVQIKG